MARPSPPGTRSARPTGWRSTTAGLLWIQTDGSQPIACNNQMLVADPATGDLRRFLVGPAGCEITGWTSDDDGRTLFVNIQHPGENAPYGAPSAQSNWPDFAGRPAIGDAGDPPQRRRRGRRHRHRHADEVARRPVRSTMPRCRCARLPPEAEILGSASWLARTRRWLQATRRWRSRWPTRCCSASTPMRHEDACCCSWASPSCRSCSSRRSSVRPSTGWPAAAAWSSRSSPRCASRSRSSWRSTSTHCCCSRWRSARWCCRRPTRSRRARSCRPPFAATRSWSRRTRSSA